MEFLLSQVSDSHSQEEPDEPVIVIVSDSESEEEQEEETDEEEQVTRLRYSLGTIVLFIWNIRSLGLLRAWCPLQRL